MSTRTWAERLANDPELKTHLDAELARERIATQAARDEASHWKDVAERLNRRVQELMSSGDAVRARDRERQIGSRRKRQFAAPILETPGGAA